MTPCKSLNRQGLGAEGAGLGIVLILSHVNIDLTAAYDHIPRDFLFRVLKLRNGAPFLIGILKLMYQHTTASVKGMKTSFEVLVRCRQGGQESPVIFNYYFDYVLKVAAWEIDKEFPHGWGLKFPFNIPHT